MTTTFSRFMMITAYMMLVENCSRQCSYSSFDMQ